MVTATGKGSAAKWDIELSSYKDRHRWTFWTFWSKSHCSDSADCPIFPHV